MFLGYLGSHISDMFVESEMVIKLNTEILKNVGESDGSSI